MKIAHCVTTVTKDYKEHVNDYEWMGILFKLLVTLKGIASKN